MSPIETLLQTGSSQSSIREARRVAKSRQPEFPDNGCANFLSALLNEAGLGVGIHYLAENLATALKEKGWQRVDTRAFQPGDIGVAEDLMGSRPGTPPNGLADHIYLVLERQSDDKMTIADNQATSPHARSVSGRDGKTPTEYFLRFDDRKFSIRVTVNDTLVSTADGYLDYQDRAWGWIRPIAEAIGAQSLVYQPPQIQLTRAGHSESFDAVVRDGQAYIWLAGLRRMPGVQVDYNATSRELSIRV